MKKITISRPMGGMTEDGALWDGDEVRIYYVSDDWKPGYPLSGFDDTHFMADPNSGVTILEGGAVEEDWSRLPEAVRSELLKPFPKGGSSSLERQVEVSAKPKANPEQRKTMFSKFKVI